MAVWIETVLGERVPLAEKKRLATDAVLRVLWLLRTHPQNRTNEYMEQGRIARTALMGEVQTAQAIEQLRTLGHVEEFPGTRRYRLTERGAEFVERTKWGRRPEE